MRTVICRREQVFQGPLLLVNRAHPLRDRTPAQLVAADCRYPEVLLDRRAAELLTACIQRVGGVREIVLVSGYRSQAEQQAIYDDTLAAEGEAFTSAYVALPGCSEHQSGLAVDLGRAAEEIDFIRPDFPDDGVCGAFRRMAAQYGFVQRYRREKENLTGIAAEPWHFRYVGVPHSLLMEANDLCLEEYAAFLRQGRQRCALPGGQTAEVFYVPSTGEETALTLPDGCCQISGDNAEGFIVTLWGCQP